jgi:DNA-binding NtrC family response regulator
MTEFMDILIVDDDEGMTETLADIIEDFGHNVEIANDGYLGIEKFTDNNYDLVFMDIKMPGINGVETFKKFKSIKPDAKVFMMTAYSLEDLIREALDEGAYGIIYKPLDIKTILDCIEQADEGNLILVVDDDLNTCETLSDVLAEKGYKVASANKTNQAMNLVHENKYDLVIMDIKMPVLNGLELYLEMKKIDPNIKVVMMTGYSNEMSDIIENALKSSAYTCLFKPLDVENLIGLVHGLCKQNSAITDYQPL